MIDKHHRLLALFSGVECQIFNKFHPYLSLLNGDNIPLRARNEGARNEGDLEEGEVILTNNGIPTGRWNSPGTVDVLVTMRNNQRKIMQNEGARSQFVKLEQRPAGFSCALLLMLSLSIGCNNPGKAPDQQVAAEPAKTGTDLPPPAAADAKPIEENTDVRLPPTPKVLPTAIVSDSPQEPVTATPSDYTALLSRTLEPDETPVHQLVRGDLGDMKNIALLMTHRSNKSSRKRMQFGGVLAVPKPNGTTTLRLPDLSGERCEYNPERILAVAFVQADEDPERELVVIATYSSGVGSGGAIDFHCNRVIDWNGERFVFLTEVEDRVDNARTVSDVRQVLRRTLGRPMSHSAFAEILARIPVSGVRVIEDSNGDEIGQQVTLDRPLTVGKIHCRAGRPLRAYSSTWGCVVEHDVAISGHTVAAGTWAELYYTTWGLAYFELGSSGAESRKRKSRTIEGVRCRDAVFLGDDGSISGCTLAAPFGAADDQGGGAAGTEVRFWDNLTVAAAWLHKPHTLRHGTRLAPGFAGFNERGDLDERFNDPSGWSKPSPVNDESLPDGQRFRDVR